MAVVDTDQSDGFSFIWTIQNFSYCLQKVSEELISPHFILEEYDGHEWYLHLYRWAMDSSDRIRLSLRRKYHGFQRKDIVFELSIRTAMGIFIKERDGNEVFSPINKKDFHFALHKKDLYEKRPDAFLDNDSLTIKCGIRKVKDTILRSVRCRARTTIVVNRTTYIWRFKNFVERGDLAKKCKSSSTVINKDSFMMYLVYKIGKFEDEEIEIQVNHLESINKSYYFTCKVSLLGVDGQKVYTVQDDCWFDNRQTNHILKFKMLSTDKILRSKELYILPSGALSLQCDFAVSSGVQYDEVEVIEYESTNIDQKVYFSCEKNSGFPDSLIGNLQLLYTDGKFSDLTIRTAGKDFPVHKTILCARSKVFSAMFESDMKESRTGVVEIKDIDVGTVSKMLLFLYTDTVGEDLVWETASSLYFAGDKYRIAALKRKCSEFLKDNLTVTNVCKVLVLSDMHRDIELKSAAQDFIYEHTGEIMGSEEWKKLMENHLQLASETMHSFIRNLKV